MAEDVRQRGVQKLRQFRIVPVRLRGEFRLTSAFGGEACASCVRRQI